MKQGYFFRFDSETAKTEGIAVYRYLKIRQNESAVLSDYPDFPVYLVLKPTAIDFYYHGIRKTEDGNAKESHEEKHVNVCILHLPLSLNLAIKASLSSVLVNSYDHSYDISGDYKIDDDDINDNKVYNVHSYSDLHVFNDGKNNKKEQAGENTISFRKLLLDFLFEFEHGEVFKNSPAYEEIEVRFKENILFSAIAAKSNYYYQRNLYLGSKRNSQERKMLANRLFTAEKQWLETVLDDGASKQITIKNNWFKSIETEVDRLFFHDRKLDKFKRWNRWNWISEKDRLNRKHERRAGFKKYERHSIAKKRKKFDKDNAERLKKSSKWFLKRYRLFWAYKTILTTKPALKYSAVFLLLVITASFLYGIVLLYNPFGILSDRFISDKVPSILFYLHIISLSFLFSWGLKAKILSNLVSITVPRLIMAISSSWILLLLPTEELWKIGFDAYIGFTKDTLLIFILLCIIVIFVTIEIKNLATGVKGSKIFLRALSVVCFGLVVSLWVGAVLMNFLGQKLLDRSGYLKTFYSQLISSPGKKLITEKKNECLLGNEVFITFTDTEKDTVSDIVKNILFLKKYRSNLQFDSTKVVLTNLKNNEFLEKYFKKHGESLYEYLNYLQFVTQKVFFKTNKNSSDENNVSTGKKIMYSFKINKIGVFHIIPHMLLYRAVFALFIGLFLQLIFEDKPITEPL